MASKQEGTVKQLVARYEHRDGGAAALAREEPGARWFDKVQQVLAAGMMERDPAVFHRLIQAGNTHRRRQYYEAKARMEEIRSAKRDAREARRAEEPLPFEERFLRDNGAVCHVARGFWNYLVRVAAEGGAGGGGASDASESSDAEDSSDGDGGGESVDCEWWKRDAFLQDHARHRERGTKWTAVLEGASREYRAPSFELSVRGSYYECSGSWWKAARHRREWEATADIEWWKDSAFYDEWLSGGREGWPAVDEAAGWDREAARLPARAEELRRREAWYEANGPRGVVRTWNNAGSSGGGGGGGASPVSPGSPVSEEKCGRREMARRAAYYAHNEEWWKSHAARLQHLHSPATCDALAYLKGPPPVALWWQAKALRDRYDAEGAGAGPDAPWKFAEENGGGGRLSEADVRGRETWYQAAWWMREKHVDGWRAAGGARATGGGWAARCDPATHHAAAPPLASEEVRRARSEWYEAVAAFDGGEEDDFEFWKERPFVDAFFIAEALLSDGGGDGGGGGGGDSGGFSWQAATAAGASEAEGAAAFTAAPAETLERRRAWYLANWWRQAKYVEEFHSLARCGVRWRSESESPSWRDADFWKGRECREEWRLLDEGEGGVVSGGEGGGGGGFQGVAWTAADALSARRNVEEAAEVQAFACSPAEAVLRHRWHTRREEVEEEEEEDEDEPEEGEEGCGDAREWWHAALFFEDFLFHGRDGRRWTAASQELGCCARGGGAGTTISEADAAEREAWYLAHWWRVSTLCAEEYHRRCAGGSDGSGADVHVGAIYQRHAACPVTQFRTGDAWWKQHWVAEDYARNGDAGGRWTAGGPVEAVFRMGAATDAGAGVGVFLPCGTPLSSACPTSEAERAERRRYYEAMPVGGEQSEEGASPALLGLRLEWYRANLRRTAAPAEVGRRARWYCGQLDAWERMRRVEWFARRRRQRRRRLSEFELAGVLQEINEGQPASDGAAAAVLEAIVALRRRGQDGDVERPLCFSLDEFLYAVGRTGFYVPPDLEERRMCAAEALLELEQAELSRVEEEAAYVAADAAGEEEEEDEGDEATDDDESFVAGGSSEAGRGEEKEVGEADQGWRRPDRHSLWLLQNGGAAASPAKRVWRSAAPAAAEAATAAAPSVVRSRRTGNLWRMTERAADAGSSSAAASSTSAAAFHGEMLDEDADFAFSGERLRASDPTFHVYAEDTDAAGFFGEKLRDSFFTEHEVYDERVATFYGEKLREGDFEALVETWSRGSVSASRAGGEDAAAACSDASSEADEEQLAEEMEHLRLSSDVDPAEARAARRRHEAAAAAAPEGGAPYRYRADRAAFFGEKIKEEEFFSSFDEHVADFYGEKLREEAFVALFESDEAAAAPAEEESEDDETSASSELVDSSSVAEEAEEEEEDKATTEGVGEETDESSRVSLEDEEASASVGATEDCAADWSGDEGWSADGSSASDAHNPHLEDEEMVAVLEAALEDDCGPEWQIDEEVDECFCLPKGCE